MLNGMDVALESHPCLLGKWSMHGLAQYAECYRYNINKLVINKSLHCDCPSRMGKDGKGRRGNASGDRFHGVAALNLFAVCSNVMLPHSSINFFP